MRHVSFPSIEQYRNVIKNVQHKACYGGTDEITGETIYNWGTIKPTLKYKGTVKLHGTNAAVCQENGGPLWVQSRENIITPQSDNAGFATFVHANLEAFNELIVTARGVYGTVAAWDRTLCIYGEWCGGNIQKSVALNGLPKMFVVFRIALADGENNKEYFTEQQVTDILDGCGYRSRGIDLVTSSDMFDAPIYNIYDFPTFEVEIDFERPDLVQNKLGEITTAVEAQCPVAKRFGVDGVGEGVVWSCTKPGWEDSGFWFKVKGEKHSVSKVKTLAAVDVEKVNTIKECVEKTCTENRMLQMWQKLGDGKPAGWTPDTTEMGPFLKTLCDDVLKEELDTIIASGLEPKDVKKEISNVGRRWFMGKL